MINKIKSLFKKNINDTQTEETEITFCLQKDGTIKVKLVVENEYPTTAEKIGEFLFYLNHGYYAKNITTTIQNMYLNENNPVERSLKELFVSNIIQTWLSHLDILNNNKEQPIISPTNFYKLYK